MLHAGLDLSRRKIDVCLLSGSGELVDQFVAAPDVDALRTLARRIDEGEVELLPYLEPTFRAELAHALGHLGLGRLFRRVTRGGWPEMDAGWLARTLDGRPLAGVRLPRLRNRKCLAFWSVQGAAVFFFALAACPGQV